MASAVILPAFGNSAESAIIARWLKQPGDRVEADEPLCEIETDKATVEVASPAAGVMLERFYGEGEGVPVQTVIAAIGEPGEDVAQLRPGGVGPTAVAAPTVPPNAAGRVSARINETPPVGISPRARGLAERHGLAPASLTGSGPGGRVIERDIQAAIRAQPRMTPLARAMVERGGFVAPAAGTGADERITARDLQAPAVPAPAVAPARDEDVEVVPLTGVRRIIAERMLASLQTTAQLTLHTSADARRLQEYRARLKSSPEEFGLRSITINDLLLFAVSRTLAEHHELNALFAENTITRYRRINLGFAVDTPRGLLVPVIRSAGALSLQALAREAARLAALAQQGRAAPNDLQGGTFTVTNLGSFGIESFTPILNPPQVAILGVGAIGLHPVESDGTIRFQPRLGLSLTVNHQVVDGAPAARFLQALARNIAELDLLLAN